MIEIRIRRLQSSAAENDDELRACAAIMAASEPWVTLGRDFAASLTLLREPSREVYVAVHADTRTVIGFVILSMHGAFTGYVQSIAIHEDWRGRGLGRRLMAYAEERIFRDSPNVFICVSDFNARARALYEHLGYTVVGELRDYIVAGHSEWLLRKSIGTLNDWRPPRD